MTNSASTRSRARPMAPDERRAAVIDAVVPLISAHGYDVSTRELAEAAGVAEGTLFRVFPDKDSVIRAAVEQIFDVDAAIAKIARVDVTAGLTDRVEAVVRLVRERMETLYRVIFTARRGPGPATPIGGPPAKAGHDTDRLDAAIAAVLSPNGEHAADEIAGDPVTAARWLRLTATAATHPFLTHDRPLPIDEIVDRVLHGITPNGKDLPCSGN